MKRGIVKSDNDFFKWLSIVKMNSVQRRDIIISLLNEEVWKVHNAFPVNGKEIYEGDILLFEMTRTVPVDHPVMTALQNETALYQGPIKWGQSGWRPFTDGADNRKCEIIGNIYETP